MAADPPKYNKYIEAIYESRADKETMYRVRWRGYGFAFTTDLAICIETIDRCVAPCLRLDPASNPYPQSDLKK